MTTLTCLDLHGCGDLIMGAPPSGYCQLSSTLRYLDLSNSCLSSSPCSHSVSLSLRQLTALSYLNLSGTAFTKVPNIYDALGALVSLRHLDMHAQSLISDVFLTEESAESLTGALANMPHLENLNLEMVSMHGARGNALSLVLTRLTALQNLVFPINQAVVVEETPLFKSLCRSLPLLTNLQSLMLDMHLTGDACRMLARSLRQMTSLVNLTFDFPVCSPGEAMESYGAVLEAVQVLKSLEGFALGAAEKFLLHEDCAGVLTPVFHKCPLRQFELCTEGDGPADDMMVDSGLSAGLESLSAIDSLNLMFEISMRWPWKFLANSRCLKTLKHLRLYQVDCVKRGDRDSCSFDDFAQPVFENLPALELLDFSSCHVAFSGGFEAFKSLTSLRFLSFNSCVYRSVERSKHSCGTFFAGVVALSPALEVLNLCHLDLCVDDVYQVACAVKAQGRINVVDVYGSLSCDSVWDGQELDADTIQLCLKFPFVNLVRRKLWISVLQEAGVFWRGRGFWAE